ncbi:MAG: hypothetical protein IKE63_06890 [Bacilli bacterium]|nr:hypothetical protein [Bacilli bacterium]
MIKYQEYFISNSEGKSNCVVRSFCKMFNKEYEEVFNELVILSKELDCNSFNDIEVFEEYLKRHSFLPIDYGKNLKIKKLKLEDTKYIIFCYDKKDWYHMVPVINNIVYDKTDKCLDLYVISVYMIQQ